MKVKPFSKYDTFKYYLASQQKMKIADVSRLVPNHTLVISHFLLQSKCLALLPINNCKSQLRMISSIPKIDVFIWLLLHGSVSIKKFQYLFGYFSCILWYSMGNLVGQNQIGFQEEIVDLDIVFVLVLHRLVLWLKRADKNYQFRGLEPHLANVL